MAYFADLTPYTDKPYPPYEIYWQKAVSWEWLKGKTPMSFRREELKKFPALNIGWLNPAEHSIPTATPSKEFLNALHFLCATGDGWRLVSCNHTLGWHPCPFIALKQCIRNPVQWGYEDEGGASEIYVVGEGVVYMAPDMIYHYVKAHGYAPPEEFVKAVLQISLPENLKEDV